MARILITGANGTIGAELTKHLIGTHDLTLVDIDFSNLAEAIKNQVTLVTKDLVKPDSWEGLLENIEYVIQLAGEADQDADFYDALLDLNYKLPHNLFKTARTAADLKRIIFASSIHAVDGYPEGSQIKIADPVRPQNFYGVSKVYLEGLAAYHAYENGIESIGIRIADYKRSTEELGEEVDKNGMAMYLSKEDFNHLIDCCLEAELQEPFLLVNGISNNAFTRLTNSEARTQLNYEPKDDAFKIMKVFD